ncbi:hypothetical protein PoB_006274200 [Plakobranchus ocellatus]|uniref:Uncharacterized protein n=1 Tax=Plakobranchus ocellatus TaxID=259542 RepID=A0AAV4CWE2_9GAST|nr:hypothetical protein PoB_006274200 [Plakobranchus ocellatus]
MFRAHCKNHRPPTPVKDDRRRQLGFSTGIVALLAGQARPWHDLKPRPSVSARNLQCLIYSQPSAEASSGPVPGVHAQCWVTCGGRTESK